jgi:hypothetical protein
VADIAGRAVAGTPGVATHGTGDVFTLYVRGTDNRVYTRTVADDDAGAWRLFAGTATTGVAALMLAG